MFKNKKREILEYIDIKIEVLKLGKVYLCFTLEDQSFDLI